jgi:acetolactate synthase I/II/III large subunit
MASLMRVNNGAEAFVESLNAHGVEHIFLNPGMDVVPIQGAIAKYKSLGRIAPKVIMSTHESVVVAAAHGYAMVSGKPQVVAVFQDVGTLQGGGAIVNLQYGRIPVILCAGKNAAPNRSNWMQEPFDQRRITRDYVKWDHELQMEENIGSLFEEAFRIASVEPCGPVYLSIPRDALTGKIGEMSVAAPVLSRKSSVIDKDAIGAAAEMLIAAQNPLILTAYAGRHPQAVAPLVELAETLGARVITTDLRMNFPSTHPLCPGIDSTKGNSYDHYIAEADLLLLIDYDFPPPRPKAVTPKADARIIHIDIEPLKKGGHLWGRTPDILIQGDSSKLLPVLTETVNRRVAAKPDSRFSTRFQRLEQEHRKLRTEWRTKALNEANQKPISAEWLCHCLNEVMDEETVLVHMAPSNADALSHQVRRTKPGTIYSWGEGAGSMGWALGAALGAKLAAPQNMVVSLIGDGGFIYGCPIAALWSAKAYNAPFLTVICNNQSYVSIRELLRMSYGEKSVSGEMGFEIGTDIKDPPDFATIAKGCNAHGQKVEEPSELMPALKTAIEQVRQGIPAVLDVKI